MLLKDKHIKEYSQRLKQRLYPDTYFGGPDLTGQCGSGGGFTSSRITGQSEKTNFDNIQ